MGIFETAKQKVSLKLENFDFDKIANSQFFD